MQSLRLTIQVWRQVYDTYGNIDVVVEPQDLGDLFHDSCVMCPNAYGLTWINGYLFVQVKHCREEGIVEIGFDAQECIYRYPHLILDEKIEEILSTNLESVRCLDPLSE